MSLFQQTSSQQQVEHWLGLFLVLLVFLVFLLLLACLLHHDCFSLLHQDFLSQLVLLFSTHVRVLAGTGRKTNCRDLLIHYWSIDVVDSLLPTFTYCTQQSCTLITTYSIPYVVVQFNKYLYIVVMQFNNYLYMYLYIVVIQFNNYLLWLNIHSTYSYVHQIAIIDHMKVRIINSVGAYIYRTFPESLPPIYIKMPAIVMQACNNIVSRSLRRTTY